MIFQFPAFSCRRFQRGFVRGNLHHPTTCPRSTATCSAVFPHESSAAIGAGAGVAGEGDDDAPAAAGLAASAAAAAAATATQGLTLIPISAQLELFSPPCNPTQLMHVPRSCLS